MGYSYNSNVQNCYNTGDISKKADVADVNVGGIVGGEMSRSTISNCYYLEGTAEYGRALGATRSVL